MGHYNNDGVWVEGNPPPARSRPMPRQMRPAEDRQHDRNRGVARQARRELRQGRYDNDGNWIEAEPANAQETLADAGSSFVTGVQQGAAGQLGVVRDVTDFGNAITRQAVQAGARFRGQDLSDDEADALVRVLNIPRNVVEASMGPVGIHLQAARHGPTSGQINEAIEDTFGEQHEPETTAGEYARTVGRWTTQALFPGGPATRATRVIAPAVAEEAAGQATEGTEAEPYARLIAGLAGAGLNEGLIAALTRHGRSPDERALRLILREMEDQGMPPEEITRQANVLTRQAPTEEVLAEVLGPGGLRLARAVANIGRGAGRATSDEALSVRAQGGRRPAPTERQPNRTENVTSIRDRVMDEAAGMTAPSQNRSPRNYWDALEALRTARAGQGADAYRAMYAQQPSEAAVQQQILPYLAEGSQAAAESGARQLRSVAEGLRAQRAAAQARNAAADEIQRLTDDLDDVVRAERQLSGVAERQMPNALSSRAIDYYQRGLGQLERAAGMGSPEARALGDARRAFNEMADEVVPGFRDARTRYGDSMRIEEAMNDGRRVFEMSEGEIDRAMRGSGGAGLTMEEFDGFMLGVLDAIERKLGQGDTAFIARLMRNQNWRSQITTAVGGEANARRFFNRLAREANMQNTRNYVQRGSQTTPIAEDIAALTEGEAEFAFMSDNARRLIASGGQVRPLVIRWLLGVWERFNRPGLRDPQVQEALARRLFSKVSRNSSRELRDALLALRNDRDVPDKVRAWLTRATAANSVTAEARDKTGEDGAADEGVGLQQMYIEARSAADAPAGRPMTIDAGGAAETNIVEADGRFYVGSRGFATMAEAEAYARFLAARAPERVN